MSDLSEATWRKSSYSQGGGNQCVEVATDLPGIVAIRDSKDPEGAMHIIAPTAFRTFLTAVTHTEHPGRLR